MSLYQPQPRHICQLTIADSETAPEGLAGHDEPGLFCLLNGETFSSLELTPKNYWRDMQEAFNAYKLATALIKDFLLSIYRDRQVKITIHPMKDFPTTTT